MPWRQRRPAEHDAPTGYQSRRAALERCHEVDMLEAIHAAMKGEYELPADWKQDHEERTASAHPALGAPRNVLPFRAIPEPGTKPQPGKPRQASPALAA